MVKLGSAMVVVLRRWDVSVKVQAVVDLLTAQIDQVHSVPIAESQGARIVLDSWLTLVPNEASWRPALTGQYHQH